MKAVCTSMLCTASSQPPQSQEVSVSLSCCAVALVCSLFVAAAVSPCSGLRTMTFSFHSAVTAAAAAAATAVGAALRVFPWCKARQTPRHFAVRNYLLHLREQHACRVNRVVPVLQSTLRVVLLYMKQCLNISALVHALLLIYRDCICRIYAFSRS